MLRGDNKRDLVREFIQTRFKCTFFSMIDMDMKRVGTSLNSRRWDGGVCPVVVFYRCEQRMRELVPLIRNRQSKQAVLLVSDDIYTAETALMKSLVTVSIVSGRLASTIFSNLQSGSSLRTESNRSEAVVETPHPLRYKGAIACSDLDTVIDQIHHATATSLEEACENTDALTEIDTLRYHVPDDIIGHCLPVLPGIRYKSQAKKHRRHLTNHTFAATLPPLVAKTTKAMMSLHQTLEYVRMAHRIQISPQIVQCPRDDNDPLLVTNANDKIRVLVDPPAFQGDSGVTTTPSLEETLHFDHPAEQARLKDLSVYYTKSMFSLKRQRLK